MGTSAGGHLVSLLATRGVDPRRKGTDLRAVAAWSPPLDLTRMVETRMARSIERFLGCRSDPCPRRQAAASPITHVSRGDPAMLIFNSRRELVPVSEPRRMARRLSAAAVRHRQLLLEGSDHAMEYEDRAIGPTIRFLRRSLRRRD